MTNLSYGLSRLNEDAIGYLSDSYGNIVQHGAETYAYTPYGELTQGIINGVNEAGYKGEVHDTSSLQYLRARNYNTKLKQFLSEDTVVGKDSHPLSQNRYAFVLNNPFKYSDPSGHYAIPVMMEDNFRPAPKKQLKVAPSLAKDSKKEEAFQKAEIAQIQTITQKKVANVPSSLKKTIQEIEDYQKAEVAQIQTIHKSTLEVIQKNDAKNEENMSRMSESSRKVVEEQIKNREILNKASKSKNEYLSNEHRKLTQQTEERSKIIQSGAIASFIALTSMFGIYAISSMPVLIPVLGAAVALGGLIPILAGIGIIAGLVGLGAGLTLYNTGTRGTDLSGRELNNREANLRKNVGSEMAASSIMNVTALTTSLILYNYANKPTETSSNKVNQETSKQNQLHAAQDDPTDEINHINENNSKSNSSKSVSYYRVQGGEMPKASQVRIVSDENGEILIPNKDANLNVSAGSREHAEYFLNQRGNGAEIVEVELPQWFDDFVKENAIPQYNYNSNPLNQNGMAPKVVDPTTPGTSYELPSPWVEWFEEYGKLIN